MPRKPQIDPPERLDDLARKRIEAWAAKHYPGMSDRLGVEWGKCRDHHLARGQQFANWEAGFRNWLRKADEFARRDQSKPKSREMPQELRGVVGRIGEKR